MWNFGLPYKLKQLIDLVARRNYLFSYDGKRVRSSLERGKADGRLYTRFNVSSRVLRYLPRDPATRQPIWTFGCGLWMFEIFGP
jgi:FMN-dependent NADH-azoreductase